MVSVPDSHPLRVLAAPLHGPTATRAQVKHALSLGACSEGFTEAYHRIGTLRRSLSRRLAVGELGVHPRGAGDVPVTVRRHHKPVDRWAFQACEAAEPLELAPARWLTGFAYEHAFGVIEHIAAHPNPYFAPRATLSLRREYRDNMEALERSIELALSRGRLPIVTGDLNMTARPGLEYSPRATFERTNLRYWQSEVVWIAYHRSLIPIERRVIDGGQDHPWLWMEFQGFGGAGTH